jgi:hypothetical protein
METTEKEVIQNISIGLVSFAAGIRPGTFGIYPDGEEISVFSKPFILALVSTQPLPCTVVPAREYSGRGVKSTTHIPLVSKLRISGLYLYSLCRSVFSTVDKDFTFLYLLPSEYK